MCFFFWSALTLILNVSSLILELEEMNSKMLKWQNLSLCLLVTSSCLFYYYIVFFLNRPFSSGEVEERSLWPKWSLSVIPTGCHQGAPWCCLWSMFLARLMGLFQSVHLVTVTIAQSPAVQSGVLSPLASSVQCIANIREALALFWPLLVTLAPQKADQTMTRAFFSCKLQSLRG